MSTYEIKDIDLAARIARLKTRHGVVETPYLFPVVDFLRQEVSLEDIYKLGFKGIITNAYLFYRRKKGRLESIHKALDWHNVVMTDSGGYQALVYGDVEVDNKTIVSYQIGIGSDIAVILDVPTGSSMSKIEAWRAVQETFRRAVEALPLIQESDSVWVLPIQGSPYNDLVIYSSIRASSLPYHMYALGSPTVLLERYDYDKLIEAVALARMHLPPDKPLHVFGVGHPMIIPFLVALGADTFDSASYVLYARDNRYMVESGTKKLDELEYFPCSCPVCTKYTPRELTELSPREKTCLLALHNIYVLKEEINRVKTAIREGRLWELLEYKSMMHPSLKSAFNTLTKYTKYIIKYTPVTRGSSHAIYLYGYSSTYNPKIVLFKQRIHNYYNVLSKEVLLAPAVRKPYRQQSFLDNSSLSTDLEKIFYHPILGIIPWGLSESYPVFQHEEPRVLEEDYRLCKQLARDIIGFIKSKSISHVNIIVCRDVWWTMCIYRELLREKISLKAIELPTCT